MNERWFEVLTSHDALRGNGKNASSGRITRALQKGVQQYPDFVASLAQESVDVKYRVAKVERR